MQKSLLPREEPAPLAPNQLELYALVSQTAQSNMRTVALAKRILGPLNASILNQCLETVIERHEGLRIRFIQSSNGPRQHVDPASPYSLDVVDLQDIPPASIDEEVVRRAFAVCTEHVNISVGPLFVAKLLRRAAHDHLLLMAADHMTADSSALSIVDREIWTLYGQIAQGQAPSLPPPPRQVGDFARWLQRSESHWLQQHGAYWEKRLAGATPVQIPVDHHPSESKPPTSALRRLSFGRALTTDLQQLARRERTLLSLVVLTVYLAVISRWCNQRDLLLAFIFNARHLPELQNVVGFLATRLYLRIELGEADTFQDLLKRVTGEFHTALKHLDYDRVTHWLPQLRMTQGDLQFNWLPSAAVRRGSVPSGIAHEAIRLEPFPFYIPLPVKLLPLFEVTDDDIVAIVSYRPDLLKFSTIEWLGENLRSFAREFVLRPRTVVGSLELAMKRQGAANFSRRLPSWRK